MKGALYSIAMILFRSFAMPLFAQENQPSHHQYKLIEPCVHRPNLRKRRFLGNRLSLQG
jgi:hypothetical protein